MEGTRHCKKCRKDKDITPENWKAKFRGTGIELTAKCRQCLERDSASMREKRTENTEKEKNEEGNTSGGADDASDFIGVSAMTLETFLDALSAAGDIQTFSALVDVSALEKEEIRDATDAIAELVWERIGYRLHSTTRYEYHCAQISTRQHKSKKILETTKQRDKGQMRTFDCQGWLTVWASPDEMEYFIRIRHKECHENMSASTCRMSILIQLWKEILKSHPRPAFSQKAVYNFWIKQEQTQWRRHENELDSAKILLTEFSRSPQYELKPIRLPDDGGGCTAIAFALPSLIRQWGGTIREVALDSTFNTTKSGFECFALLGEVFGSGLPLGFLLIKCNNPDPNQKEQYIRSVIRHFVDEWNIHVHQCLSDKDIIEINALLGELPDDIKYQICFWHSIRIVKGRLSVLARRPAFYDVNEAFSEFDWIALDFVPVAQLDPNLRTADRLKVAQNAIPTVKLRFTGQTSETSAPARPKLIINLNGQPRTVATATDDRLDRLSDSLDELQRLLDSLDDDDEDLVRGVKRKRGPNPSHGPSTLPKTPNRGSGDKVDDPFIISSSPIREEEYEDDTVQDFIKKRITELRDGINILEEQLATPGQSKVWLKSMKDRNIGHDVAQMAKDVRHFTQTGQIRPTTWAKAGSKSSARYTGNTMGYHKN
ncbi:hypothetical protein DFH09DRAFT_1270764 [Mycena vulgaris]|nr:hypothetical protein DFH09DRAFT_1270764 [Mycena vulgaris]